MAEQIAERGKFPSVSQYTGPVASPTEAFFDKTWKPADIVEMNWCWVK